MEELVFVEEEVNHAREDLVVAWVRRGFVALEEENNVVDGSVFVVHLLVDIVNFRFGLWGVVDDVEGEFTIRAGGKAH